MKKQVYKQALETVFKNTGSEILFEIFVKEFEYSERKSDQIIVKIAVEEIERREKEKAEVFNKILAFVEPLREKHIMLDIFIGVNRVGEKRRLANRHMPNFDCEDEIPF